MCDLGSHFMVRGLTSVTPVLVACQTDVAFMRGACDDSDVLTIYSTTPVHVKHASEPRTRACTCSLYHSNICSHNTGNHF